jgi:hypothetical protein
VVATTAEQQQTPPASSWLGACCMLHVVGTEVVASLAMRCRSSLATYYCSTAQRALLTSSGLHAPLRWSSSMLRRARTSAWLGSWALSLSTTAPPLVPVVGDCQGPLGVILVDTRAKLVYRKLG